MTTLSIFTLVASAHNSPDQAINYGSLESLGSEIGFLWNAPADRVDGETVLPSPAGATSAQELGTILVDNYLSLSDINISDLNDDAQGFTTGPTPYRLTGVEITVSGVDAGESFSLGISKGTAPVPLEDHLYELVAPANQDGKVFFAAPANAYLEPNSDHLVRITMAAGDARIGTAHTNDESTLGLTGWSVANNHWTSHGSSQGISWTSVDTYVYAITVRGNTIADKFGSNSHRAGRITFSRYTGESPIVKGFICSGTDTDWFKTSLSFDYGGRYRVDVEPISLTNDDDIGVRAFYVDYPQDHSRDPVVELTPVSDPPEGYVSWHFVAGRNYGPYFEVSAENGTIGAYAIRVVYDPDRIWTGTEVVRGDLPHDDTTWATIEVDADFADDGIYHYFEDHDWFAVELESDTNYLFQAVASGGQYSSYIDPALRVYDDAGNELAVDYVSGGQTAAQIIHQVGTGEGGTYYLDVTNAVFHDDATTLDVLGLTDGYEVYSPFLGTRYYVLALDAGRNNRRSLRSVEPTNAAPRILNWTALTLLENSTLQEYITAHDNDEEDSVTVYDISGGDDRDLFYINNAGLLSMTITPDFEVPVDSDMDNAYEVQVEATSGTGERERSTAADFTVTVTDEATESERVLVSNTGRRDDGTAKVEHSDSALRIDTGSNPDGYVIHGVALSFAEALDDPSGVRVSFRSSHKPGKYPRPEVEIFAFSNPSSISARLTEFLAPADTVLEPNTTYYIMIERTGDSPIRFQETASDSNDSISESGWSIGDVRLHRTNKLNGPWKNARVNSDHDQLKLRVIGYPRNSE